MRVTQLHLAYWRQRACGSLPKWARALSATDRRITVDDLLTSAEPRHKKHLEAYNLLVILRSARKRDQLRSIMRYIAEYAGSSRRRGYVKKWLLKIEPCSRP